MSPRTIPFLAIAALCLCAPAAALAEQFPAPYRPVRIITYNVKDGMGNPGSTQYEAVGAMITTLNFNPADNNSGLNPDIVCFQEMNPSNMNELVVWRNQFLPNYSIHTAFGDGFNYNAVLVSPDFTVTNAISFSAGGPRGNNRVTMTIPGAAESLTVYNSHFKAFGDSASQATRTQEANTLGNVVLQFRYCGAPCVPDLDEEPLPLRVVTAGDYNSNNNFDGTITGVFTHFTLGVPTGLQNIPVESLFGRTVPQLIIATFPGSFNSRLDYICPDPVLAAAYDEDGNGTLSQAEINTMGFVYYSNDNTPEHAPGQFANGNPNATTQGSDHRPVVMDLRMPADPAFTGACCLPEGDCVIQTELACQQLFGTFQGIGTDCDSSPCPDITGACCLPNDDCTILSEAACTALNGTFNGIGSDCTPNPCVTFGACCFSCSGTQLLTCSIKEELDCIANQGTFLGTGTTCSGSPCASQCSGDINADRKTDLNDFIVLAGNFGGTGGRQQGDLNCSGSVDLNDFIILAGDFGCDAN